MMKKTICTAIFVALAALSALGQCPVGSPNTPQACVTGQYNAMYYNYGGQPAQIAPPALKVDIGNGATGVASITVRINAVVTTILGDQFMPFATNAPILVGGASNQELVTPTSVSCTTPTQVGTCVITATFANTHGGGEPIESGTFGAQEAINRASLAGSGYVLVDALWLKATGSAANAKNILAGTATGNIGNVSFVLNSTFEPTATFVKDVTAGVEQYWYGGPGLTNIATPTALTTASNITTATTGGTIATGAAVRLCVEAVDQFGGETACSADAAGTAVVTTGAGNTNSITIAAAGVPTGTGIVGYRLYASAAAGTTQTETVALATNITGAAAPLCPLPGCFGAGANVILTSLPATTNAGPNPGTSGAATALSVAHTTVVNKVTGLPPQMLPYADTFGAGSFPVSVTSATTLVVGFDVMGEIPYPAGFLNVQGATYRICGGGTVTPSVATVAGTWTLNIGNRQNSAGTSTSGQATKITFVASTMWTNAANTFEFCTDLTTTTVGTAGVLEGHSSWFCGGPTTGTAAGVTGCSPWFNAASGSIDLTQQGVIDLTYLQSAASWTLPQLRYFSIRRL